MYGDVTRELDAWNTQTALGLFWPSRVKVPAENVRGAVVAQYTPGNSVRPDSSFRMLDGGHVWAAAALYAVMRSVAHWLALVEETSTLPSPSLKFPVTDVPGETPTLPV